MGIEINNHSCEKENVQGYHRWKKNKHHSLTMKCLNIKKNLFIDLLKL